MSSQQVISLYRGFLREAKKFSNYNVREYAKRKAGDEFHKGAALTDAEAIKAAYARGQEEFKMVQRQVAVYSMYAGVHKNIMELKEATP
mmetsp:Transcript_58905/g.188209  ORF Transcript_58905/g.188209 Transcript_58905/m.188209 type:complete len:89 (-) Transcript_58905:21-287(-)